MPVESCLQIASDAARIPDQQKFSLWISKASQYTNNKAINIRIVDEPEMTELNLRFRQDPRSTNVLSFPLQLPDGVNTNELGDIVMCAPVIQAEARRQNKEEIAHWAHMTIHGILHLAGYDHLNEADAAGMEAIEIQWLAQFGYPNPYAADA